MLHMAGIRAASKMDTPTGLYVGTCTCSWTSTALDEAHAKHAAREHADAKNEELTGGFSVTLYSPALDLTMELTQDVGEHSWPWESQARQFPANGDPGLSYSPGDVPGYELPVNCLLQRNEKGRLVAIGYHYPMSYGGAEQVGNCLILVHPKYVHKGLGGRMLAELDSRYHLNFAQQHYTGQGLALAVAHLMKNGYEVVEETN